MRFKKNIKSQTGIEFIIIAGVAIFFFTLFLAGVHSENLKIRQREEEIIIEDIALSVKEEIDIARETSDGYKRNFSIPTTILGREYKIQIIQNKVYLETEKYGFSTSIGEVEGEIKKGENKITRENGKVYIN